MQEQKPVQKQEPTTVEPVTVTAPAKLVPYKEIPQDPKKPDWNDVSNVKPVEAGAIDPNARYMGEVMETKRTLKNALDNFESMRDGYQPQEDKAAIGFSMKGRGISAGIGFTWGGGGSKDEKAPDTSHRRNSPFER